MSDNIRRHHRMGREAIKSGLSTTEFAAQKGIHAYTLRRAKKFARTYTQAELGALCRLRRPNGLPLQWGHVIYLLTIRNKQVRLRYEMRAAEGGWNAQQLNAKISATYRKRTSGHGRSMAKPTTPAAGLEQMTREGEVWLRRCDMVMGVVRAAQSKRISRETRESAGEAVRLLRSVQEEAGSLADELGAVAAGK